MRITETFNAEDRCYRTRQCVNPECNKRYTTHEVGVEEWQIPKAVRNLNRRPKKQEQ